jgi:zinc protease
MTSTFPALVSGLRRSVPAILLAIVSGASLIVSGQSAVTGVAQRLTLADTMPMDAQIKTGTLPNGLRYYVRANQRPQKRAELRLGVNAGSLVEDDDQRGVAHFVEHMAFNGTRNFPGNDLVRFMQSLGMSLGPDVNATTTFDQTVYSLRLPTDNPAVIDRALQVLQDWAHAVTFDDAEIDQERAVIVEEWRLRRGAAARLSDALLPELLKGSRYADRLPIGSPEIIQRVSHDRLRQFYTDWYRPDLMSVVAVGDFDAAAVENQIRARFSSIPAVAKPRPRPVFDVPDQPGTRYTILTDKEIPSARVEMNTLLPARDQSNVGAYRQQAVDRLFAAMLTARMAEQAEKPGSPLLAAAAARRTFFARTKDAAVFSAAVREDGVDRGLDLLITEAARVTRFGFTAPELDRQKQALLRAYERLVAEKSAESASLADEYLRNYFVNESLPGIELEYALHQRFLPEITLAEVNRLASDWFSGRNRIVVVSLPDKAGVTVPTDASLAAVVTAASARTLTAYVAPTSSGTLVASAPTPGKVVKTTSVASVGITEWELSNGVRVVIKPTTFKDDEVVFRAIALGGSSLAADNDFIPAGIAAQVVAVGGAGTHSEADLRRLLTGKVASVTPFIAVYEQGMQGGGSPKDIETLFQLIYLRFTQPRADRTIVGVLASQARSLAANQAVSPDALFQQTVNAALAQNHPRAQPVTPAIIDQWNLDKSLAFYKSRFADAAAFTFVFVGNIDPNTLRPLAERYLGSLPSLRRQERWRDVGIRAPRGIVEKQIRKGLEPKARARIIFSGPIAFTTTNLVSMRAMTLVLEGQLRGTLRELLGGTYSVTTATGLARIPEATYTISVDFTCDPQRTEELVGRAFQIVEVMKTRRIPETALVQVRGLLAREFETNSKQNGFLLAQLSSRYEYGDNVADLWDTPKAYQAVDGASIQAAANLYLDTKNYIRVTLLPEK